MICSFNLYNKVQIELNNPNHKMIMNYVPFLFRMLKLMGIICYRIITTTITIIIITTTTWMEGRRDLLCLRNYWITWQDIPHISISNSIFYLKRILFWNFKYCSAKITFILLILVIGIWISRFLQNVQLFWSRVCRMCFRLV